MTRYTVIGSSGFIGGHVTSHLKSLGSESWCPGRDERGLFDTDLGRVIYCAGLTGDYRSRPLEAVEAHVSLLARLIERASFERIVYLSSTRLYDQLTNGIGSEDRAIPVNPAEAEHLYELSKLLGENLTVNRTQGRGVVARLSYVFGWDESAQGFLSDWLKQAAGARSLDLDSSPHHARDYIHVDDVATALVAMADSTECGIINVASGQRLSNERIASLFRKRGWNVTFARDSANPDAGVMIDSSKLAAMGLRIRPALDLIESYLDALPHPA